MAGLPEAGRGSDELLRLVWSQADQFPEEVSRRALRPLNSPVRVGLAREPRREAVEVRGWKLADRGWVRKLSMGEFDETLVWTAQEGLLEGTRSNVFVQVQGRWKTPPEEAGLVPGVVRDQVLEVAHRQGLEIDVEPLPVGILDHAQAMFLSGSGLDVTWVDEFHGRRFSADPGDSGYSLLRAALTRERFRGPVDSPGPGCDNRALRSFPEPSQ